MRIAKPILLVITPLGVGFGLYEAWRLAGGLAFIMLMLVLVMSFAMFAIVHTIRMERAEKRKVREETDALARMGAQGTGASDGGGSGTGETSGDDRL